MNYENLRNLKLPAGAQVFVHVAQKPLLQSGVYFLQQAGDEETHYAKPRLVPVCLMIGYNSIERGGKQHNVQKISSLLDPSLLQSGALRNFKI